MERPEDPDRDEGTPAPDERPEPDAPATPDVDVPGGARGNAGAADEPLGGG